MSDTSARLSLPFILPSQSQKHVTHNEALQILDAVTQLVLESSLADPPASPAEGAAYAIATGATGAWAGQDGKIAAWQDSAWTFLAPQAGWLACLRSTGKVMLYGTNGWQDLPLPSIVSVSQLGVGATPDSTNRFSISSPASLFNNAGGDHQLKINKAAAGNTASLLFQSGWSGRAEMGLAGSDSFAIKVSPDGGTWLTALSVTGAGQITQPNKPAARAQLSASTLAITNGLATGFDNLALTQGGVALSGSIAGGGQALAAPVEGLYAVSLSIAGTSASSYAASLVSDAGTELLKLSPGTASAFDSNRMVLAKLSAGTLLSVKHSGTATLGASGRTVALDMFLL
ncbi:DUF2793 domain-containing protein [Allorhizobium undicola]|uniref:DUF2793 domain-containing protein n=1 Tax=Allorhizobium undicola TaxID=78527 RepID=UPI000480EDE3|nr:DUF2793 domain-containing protein [Allorhizobium undicola]